MVMVMQGRGFLSMEISNSREVHPRFKSLWSQVLSTVSSIKTTTLPKTGVANMEHIDPKGGSTNTGVKINLDTADIKKSRRERKTLTTKQKGFQSQRDGFLITRLSTMTPISLMHSLLNSLMQVLDFAKQVLDFTKQVLDFTKQVLDFAKQVLDFAKQVLDFAKQVLDFAKQVLDSAKQVLDFTKQVLDFTKQVLDFAKQVLDFAKQVLDSAKQVLDFTKQVLYSARQVLYSTRQALYFARQALYFAMYFANPCLIRWSRMKPLWMKTSVQLL